MSSTEAGEPQAPPRGRLAELQENRFAFGSYVLVTTALAIGLLAGIAVVTREPFVFPSLGPTAFMLFFAATSPGASPRNVISGHLIGVLCGYAALVLFGLTAVTPDLEDLDWRQVGSVTLALCATSAIMIWFAVPHAPACATTLIVALGLMRTPGELAILMLAVVLVTALGWIVNRAMGVDYPLWAPDTKVMK